MQKEKCTTVLSKPIDDPVGTDPVTRAPIHKERRLFAALPCQWLRLDLPGNQYTRSTICPLSLRYVVAQGLQAMNEHYLYESYGIDAESPYDIDGCCDVESIVDSQVYEFYRANVLGNKKAPFKLDKDQITYRQHGKDEVPEPVKKKRRTTKKKRHTSSDNRRQQCTSGNDEGWIIVFPTLKAK